MSDSDTVLRRKLIRLAHENPQFRPLLVPLLREAAEFPADSIGAEVSGPEGGPGSDAQKPWAKGEFTQQENSELDGKQESGQLSNGKADKSAAEQPVVKLAAAEITAAVASATSMEDAARKVFAAARARGACTQDALEDAKAAVAEWKARPAT